MPQTTESKPSENKLESANNRRNMRHLKKAYENNSSWHRLAVGIYSPTDTARIQTKLTVGAPRDTYEREADTVAKQVMRMPASVEEEAEPGIQRIPLHTQIQRMCEGCQEELQRELQIDSDSDVASNTSEPAARAIANQINSMRGNGQPLPQDTRSFFETRFGSDFGQVRVHTGTAASDIAHSLNARAFTLGSEITFGEGQYAPNSHTGKQLLAHELTHVVQQGGAEKGQLVTESTSNASTAQGNVIQRQTITMRGGNTVGSGTADNRREDVLHLLDSLHRLWSISNSDWAATYGQISSLPRGSRVPSNLMTATLSAMARNSRASLHKAVALHFLNIHLVDNVGAGQTNNAADLRLIMPLLHAHGVLANASFTSESATVASASGTVSDASIPNTISSIAALKVRIASGRIGWAPIHADESRDAGDLYGTRTFEFGKFSIFLPRNAPASTNKVHAFFSPGDATGGHGLNALLHHGLRGGFEDSEWILIGVPGKEPGFETISTAEIQACLNHVGRGTSIEAMQLSAHSRGHRGLRETVRNGLINISLIRKVVILDASYANTMGVLSRSGIPANRITSYQVTVTPNRIPGDVNRRLPSTCMRAIGYSRLIQDAMRTRPGLTIPTAIRSQLLSLPDRGCFTTSTSPTGCQVNIVDFCRTNRGAIRAIIRNENHATTGLKTFLDTHDLGRLGGVFSAGIYSHHFFVAEIAHEIND